MRFYRIADSRYSPESGDGAKLHGGRWNSPGRAVIYACETQTGAILEKLVHTNGRMPKHQVCVTYEAPNALKAIAIEPESIPGWGKADMIASRTTGDAWLASGESVILRVPSVVFSVEYNVLLNPGHQDFAKIRVVSVEPVRWDDRLFEEQPPRSKSGD
ncbi:MAG TPA: RES domain-containing protein [Steroidobacteraceae bacterium]|nr:RES domain-containing protein [Steroidobacteraceae bacterium]